MTAVDEARAEQFMHRMVGYMTGAAVCFGVWLGDELGLYRVLADYLRPMRAVRSVRRCTR
jgi:hypothetical protein